MMRHSGPLAEHLLTPDLRKGRVRLARVFGCPVKTTEKVFLCSVY